MTTPDRTPAQPSEPPRATRDLALLAVLLSLRLGAQRALGLAMSAAGSRAAIERLGEVSTVVALGLSTLFVGVVAWRWVRGREPSALAATGSLASVWVAQAAFLVVAYAAPDAQWLVGPLRAFFPVGEALAWLLLVRRPDVRGPWSLVWIVALASVGLDLGWRVVGHLVDPAASFAPEAGFLGALRELAFVVVLLRASRQPPPTVRIPSVHALALGAAVCAPLLLVSEVAGVSRAGLELAAVFAWGVVASREPRAVSSFALVCLAAALGVELWAGLRDPRVDLFLPDGALERGLGASSVARAVHEVLLTAWQASVVGALASRGSRRLVRWMLLGASLAWALGYVAMHVSTPSMGGALAAAWGIGFAIGHRALSPRASGDARAAPSS